MKKRNVLNLIKYHVEKNEYLFTLEAHEISRYFDSIGDHQLADYVLTLLNPDTAFFPQGDLSDETFFMEVLPNGDPLPLPDCISEDLLGVMNAIQHNACVNRFLFEGAPGTGKTESVKHVARLLKRKLLVVKFDTLIDSKLGQTAKNIVSVFRDINRVTTPENYIILFDEIDAIALDRINNNDLREMGRVTSTILRELDNLNSDVILIATTNLYKKFDKALSRRFDAIINFDRYTQSDLVEVAVAILDALLAKFNKAGRDMKLFKKVISLMDPLPLPGELKNMLKTALAFSAPDDKYDYLRRLTKSILGEPSIPWLLEKKFTVREIEVLTGTSKSQVGRIKVRIDE